MKHDFELRRMIFGLTAIISTPPQALPAIVSQRLPDIAKQLSILTLKMRDERKKVLEDNETYCKEEEEKRLKGEKSEDEDEFVDEDGGSDDDDDDEAGESEQQILKKIEKARKDGKIAAGKGAVDDEDDYDDEEDSDYEYTGGDLAIYDSALDDVDELLYVKQALESLNVQNPAYVQSILSALAPEESAKFNEVMQ